MRFARDALSNRDPRSEICIGVARARFQKSKPRALEYEARVFTPQSSDIMPRRLRHNIMLPRWLVPLSAGSNGNFYSYIKKLCWRSSGIVPRGSRHNMRLPRWLEILMIAVFHYSTMAVRLSASLNGHRYLSIQKSLLCRRGVLPKYFASVASLLHNYIHFSLTDPCSV